MPTLAPATQRVTTVLPRRFTLIRQTDCPGVAAFAVVAYGVAFADGQVVLRWCLGQPMTSIWNSVDDVLAAHGHGEADAIEWLDAPPGDLEELPVTASSRRRRQPPMSVAADHPADNAGGDATDHAGDNAAVHAANGRSDSAATPTRPAARRPPRQPGRHRRPDPSDSRP